MKNNLRISMTSFMIGIALMAGNSLAFAGTEPIGAAAVKSGETYTISQMLTYAIQDEYTAYAEYDAIIKAFNANRPFTNILKSEATHISLLEPLFKTYKVTLPSKIKAEDLELPKTLTEAYEAGVTAEIKNIAMYEQFLKQKLPEDVKLVFERLKSASESHLKAYQNALTGGGRGNGRQK